MELSEERVRELSRQAAQEYKVALRNEVEPIPEVVRFLAAELEKDAKPGIRERVSAYISLAVLTEAQVKALRWFADWADPPAPKRKVRMPITIKLYLDNCGLITPINPGLQEAGEDWTFLTNLSTEVEVDEAPERDA